MFTLNEYGSDTDSTNHNVFLTVISAGRGSYNLIYKLGISVLTLSKATFTAM